MRDIVAVIRSCSCTLATGYVRRPIPEWRPCMHAVASTTPWHFAS
jgi:hypothetical protein